MNEQIKVAANDIATEIMQRGIFNIDEVQSIIASRISLHLPSIIGENANIAEVEYQKLLGEISKYRVGSTRYIELGYKLSQAKAKKAFANRALNSVKRDDNFSKLYNLLCDKYGRDEANYFCKQAGAYIKQD